MDSEYLGYTSSEYSERLEIVTIQRIYIRMCQKCTDVHRVGYTGKEAEHHSVSSEHIGYNEKA